MMPLHVCFRLTEGESQCGKWERVESLMVNTQRRLCYQRLPMRPCRFDDYIWLRIFKSFVATRDANYVRCRRLFLPYACVIIARRFTTGEEQVAYADELFALWTMGE